MRGRRHSEKQTQGGTDRSENSDARRQLRFSLVAQRCKNSSFLAVAALCLVLVIFDSSLWASFVTFRRSSDRFCQVQPKKNSTVSTAELTGVLFWSVYHRLEKAGSTECCHSASVRCGYMYYGPARCITSAAMAAKQMLFCLEHHFLGLKVLHWWGSCKGIPFSVWCRVFIERLASFVKGLLSDRFSLRVGRQGRVLLSAARVTVVSRIEWELCCVLLSSVLTSGMINLVLPLTW